MLDCIVVGAGFTGLAAATELRRLGKSVLVVEARDRVGGRVENMVLPDGQVIELGGQWIAPSHEHVHALVERYQLQQLPASPGRALMRMEGNVVELPIGGEDDAERTPFEVADLGQGLLRFRRLANRVQEDPVWAQANRVWLEQDLRRWLHANLRTPGGRADFEHVLRAVRVEDHATLRDGLDRVNQGVDLERLVAINDRVRQTRVRGGIWTVAERLAAELGDAVRTGVLVTGLVQDAEQVSVVLADGERLRARRALLTLPPWLAQKLSYDPELPSWREDVVHRTTPGSVVKAFAIYERPWWREHGWSGQMSADEGPVRVSFDTTDPGCQRGVLMGFFEGSEAETVSRLSVSLRRRLFLESLSGVFGPQAAEALDYVDRDWVTDPYTQGCHGAHFAPGLWRVNGQLLAEPFGRIHFAGAEYSSEFNGYIEGALLSAQEAASTIVRADLPDRRLA